MKYMIMSFVFFGIASNSYAADCVDFAGNWKGQCVSSTGQTTPSVLDIVQKGCTNLKVSTIGEDFLRVGAGLTFTQKVLEFAVTTNFYSWWNKDKSILDFFMHVEATGKDISYEDNILGGYKLVNNQLITYSKGGFGELTCTHSK